MKLVILLLGFTLAEKIKLSADSEKYKNIFRDRFDSINSYKVTDDEGDFDNVFKSRNFQTSAIFPEMPLVAAPVIMS